MSFQHTYITILSLLWGIAAAGLAWYSATLTREITYITLADGRKQERRLPFIFRLFLPLAPNCTLLFNHVAFAKTREKIDSRLTSAGFEGLLSATEYLSLRLLFLIIPGSLWIIFVGSTITTNHGFLAKIAPAIYILGPLCFFMYPSMWLSRALNERHRSIQRSLPFVLDILTLSVEAGMDFMTSLQRHVERASVDPLSEELIRVIREIQLGKTRRDALRHLSIRVNLQDLRSVVNALIQADELGVSIGSILRIQSDQIRQRRFERAEKLANEAPVKMLFPLMFFIFPAVFLVLLGPVLYRMVQQGL